MHRTTRSLLFAALTTGLVLAACGDDDDAVDTAAEDTTTTVATSASDEAADDPPSEDESAPAGEVLEVDAVDYAFEGLPDSVPAGTRLTFTNSSEVELHELVAMRIPDEEARPVEELVALPEEELMGIFQEPPATVLLAPPGGEQVAAVGDGTLTEPGRYALVCFVPTGADPAAFMAEAGPDGPPEVAGGPPHVVHGMHAELTVE